MAKDKAKAGEEGAVVALAKVYSATLKYHKAVASEREVKRKASEIEGGAQAKHENVMMSGVPSGADDSVLAAKWIEVASAYQEWDEAKAEAGEMRKDAHEKTKRAAAALDRAMVDSAQMTIPGTE